MIVPIIILNAVMTDVHVACCKVTMISKSSQTTTGLVLMLFTMLNTCMMSSISAGGGQSTKQLAYCQRMLLKKFFSPDFSLLSFCCILKGSS